MPSNIRVAISGGGVAGASVIHALLQYPHLDAHIFESAPAFKEAGVAFGITRNATTALDLISPDAADCLVRAGGVQMKGVRFYMGQGPGKGDLLYEADNEQQGKVTTTIVQRANFLHELLAGIPKERMHASKKLESVDKQQDGSLLLHFADGSTHETDILIGADGIRSTVRKLILGQNDPAATPVNTGWLALMTLQPYEKAQKSIGKAYINVEDAREINHIADGVFYLHNVLSNGNIVQFSVCHRENDAVGTDQWQKVLSADEIRKIYTHPDRPEYLNKAVEDLLCDVPEQRAIYLWEHPPARTFVDGPMVIIGDAAHATTPWQGSGGGMCVEDSLIISTLLGKAQNPMEAQAALKVFDKVRRARTQRLVESSHGTGEILTGRSEYGLDSAKVKEALAPRWDFIVDFDNEKHRDESLALLAAELKA